VKGPFKSRPYRNRLKKIDINYSYKFYTSHFKGVDRLGQHKQEKLISQNTSMLNKDGLQELLSRAVASV